MNVLVKVYFLILIDTILLKQHHFLFIYRLIYKYTLLSVSH